MAGIRPILTWIIPAIYACLPKPTSSTRNCSICSSRQYTSERRERDGEERGERGEGWWEEGGGRREEGGGRWEEGGGRREEGGGRREEGGGRREEGGGNTMLTCSTLQPLTMLGVEPRRS
jgi:hypothetical protein